MNHSPKQTGKKEKNVLDYHAPFAAAQPSTDFRE